MLILFQPKNEFKTKQQKKPQMKHFGYDKLIDKFWLFFLISEILAMLTDNYLIFWGHFHV